MPIPNIINTFAWTELEHINIYILSFPHFSALIKSLRWFKKSMNAFNSF